MNINVSDKAVVISYDEHERLMRLKETMIDKEKYDELEKKFEEIQKEKNNMIPKQHYEQAVKNYYDLIGRNDSFVKACKEKIEVLSKNITNNKIAVKTTRRSYNACSPWVNENTLEVNAVEEDKGVVEDYLKNYAEEIEKNKYKNMSIFDFIKFRSTLRKDNK
jgi:hypothetical protein